MSYSLHVYPPLRPERREIRVLTLFPSSFDDPIRCDLEILSLDERPQYEALSYVWSMPPGNTDIIFREKQRAVTLNLGLALRRLRKMRDVRKIWVDALCIDQDDKAEKESQVSLMGEIYRRAAEVFIWLGDSVTQAPIDNLTIEQRPDLPWTGKTFDDLFTLGAERPSTYMFHKFGDIEVDPEARLIEWEDDKGKLRNPGLAALWLLYTLTSGCHMSELPCFVWDDDDMMLKLSGKRFQATLKALVDLLSLPWWTRIWVVQETVLPPKATVVLGSLHAQWDMFAAASKFFELHLATCCSTSFNRLDSEYKNMFEQCMIRIRELMSERDIYQATGSARDAFDLIWQYRNRDATDSRDMIYGLLGIASDLRGNGGITPDYDCSKHELYLRTALLLIGRMKSLRILEGIRPEESDMSSWMPDWSATIDARLWLQERTRLRCSEFQTSKGVQCSAQLSANASLLVKGIYIDTVVTVGQIIGPDESTNSLAHHLQGWLELTCLPRDHSKAYIGGGSRGTAFWGAVIRDRAMEPSGANRRALPSDYEAIATWWYHEDTQRILKGQPKPATSMAQKALDYVKSFYPKKKQPWLDPDALTMFLRAMGTASAGHTFFITAQGYYGLGRPRVGDQVFVLHGGVVPFLLRSVDPLKYFQLVGDCYVQGIMYGEAMEGWEEKTQELVLVGNIKPRL